MLMFLILCVLARTSLSHEVDYEKLVVNGEVANIIDYPFMVGIYNQGAFTCGGSIYNQEWILTAAHCVVDGLGKLLGPNKLIVQVGNSGLNKGQQYNVATIVKNPHFQFAKLSDDIALLKLSKPLTFGDTVRAAEFPTSLENVNSGIPSTILGWGYSKVPKPMDVLQKAVISVFPVEKCKQIYTGKNEVQLSSNICAQLLGGGKGQCTGDSGGPLVIKGKNGYKQVGVVSFSEKPCANPTFPGVFSKVSYYIDWIKSVAGPPAVK